ncbi:MAG: tetratricopeptide repeat protein, partial [Acidiferrobacteraceae bacterium]
RVNQTLAATTEQGHMPDAPTVYSRPGIRKVLLPLTPAEEASRDYLAAAAALERGENQIAIVKLRASLSLNPADTRVRELLAGLELQRGKMGAAKVLLKQGLAIDPRDVRFAELLANAYLRQGQVGKALAVLTAHRAQALGNARYLAFLAALEERSGLSGQAATDYRAALALAPGDGASWAGLAIALQARHPRAARHAYRRALTDPRLPRPLAEYVRKQLLALNSP